MSGSIFTGIVLVVAVCLLLSNAESVYSMLVGSLQGIFFWKKAVRIDSLPSTARERDEVAMIMGVPAAQVLSTFFVSQSPATQGWSEAVLYLVSLGILVAYALIRLATRVALSSFEISRHRWGMGAIRLSANYFIIDAALASLTGIVGLMCGVPIASCASVILVETVAIYALMLLCKIQVLRHNQGFFLTFLYLCALEILPIAPIVAAVYLL